MKYDNRDNQDNWKKSKNDINNVEFWKFFSFWIRKSDIYEKIDFCCEVSRNLNNFKSFFDFQLLIFFDAAFSDADAVIKRFVRWISRFPNYSRTRNQSRRKNQSEFQNYLFVWIKNNESANKLSEKCKTKKSAWWNELNRIEKKNDRVWISKLEKICRRKKKLH